MNYLLPHAISRSAEKFPDKEAFRCGNKSITYYDLERKTNQLANQLIQLGIKKGDRVGIYLRRCLESAIAVYGIMKAGAVYVPMDPDAPAARTSFLIADCAISVIISDNGQLRNLVDALEQSHAVTVIGVSGTNSFKCLSWEMVADQSDMLPELKILGADLAYIMYTSGSTGYPKGIMHTHDSGLSYAKLSAHLYGLNSDDRIGNHAALHFDISTMGYFTGPLVGATTVIIPEAYTKMPASLSQLMEKEALTVWYSVPLALVQLLSHGLLEQRDLSSLRWVLFGGETFPTKYLKSLMQLWWQATFCNVYGPAEVNQCTYYHLKDIPKSGAAIPIGYVWDDTEVLVVNELDEQITGLESGELLVRSSTMMQGYWNQPELTANALYTLKNKSGFVKTYYRTGDMVQYNEHQELMFLGRKDRQVKVRGYRVELDEIEAAVLKHEDIVEAGVFTVANQQEGLLIEAAVIVKKGVELSETDIMSFVQNSLPHYAIPHKITIAATLPHTSTGKVDRKRLKEMAENMNDTI